MFRRSLICCLTFTAMLICSSTFANATLTDEAAGTGVISGRVTKLDATTAIAGASIKVFQGATLSATAIADSAGDYTISNLDPGSYSVEVSSTGYETKTQAGVLVSNGATTTVNFTLAVPINYVYDELGRLVSAIDQNGNAATYAYDAVGNLLSISRQDQTQAAIIQFSPAGGSVGATVTIYGTGFSATAAQNAVTFNGAAATVAQSSTTHIVATVPSGATTGPIAVTSPVGSATSSASFIIGSSPLAPTITSFTPTIASPGAAVTITGTNFETTPLNNKATFNLGNSIISSATSTSISTSVPTAGSGKISVATPNGKATSTDDFFIPPPTYTVAEVMLTARTTIGSSYAASVSTVGKIGLILFDGSMGQRIYLNIPSVAFNGNAYVRIYNPDSTLLTSKTVSFSTSTYIDTTALPATGTYTILVDPWSNATGSVTLNLIDVPPDVTGTITPGGSSVPVSITTAGQNARLTFSGSAAQKISLRMTGVTIGSTTPVTFFNPNGTTLAFFNASSSAGGWLEATALPVAGTYTILMDPNTTFTGNATFALYDVVDINGSITSGGTAVTAQLTTPGQNASYTFNGSAGQRVSLNLTGVTIGGSKVYIYKPDGSTLASNLNVGTAGAFFDTMTLPVTGTYTIFVDPNTYLTGNMTLALYDVTDFTGTITIGGSAVAVTISTPGQNGQITFSGSAAQKISLRITGVTIGSSTTVTIFNPNGTTLASFTAASSAGGWLDATTLPASGTYTIFMNPPSTYTGNATLALYDVVDINGSITPGGTAVTAQLTTPGQNASYTFNGSAGQRVSLNLTGVTISGIKVYIYKPDGSTLASNLNVGLAGAFFDTMTLPVSGTYTIFVDPSSYPTGNITLTLYDVVDFTGTTTIGDPAVAVTINAPGQNGQMTFSGSAAQQVTVRITGNTMSTITVKLLNPDGTTLTSKTSSGSNFDLTTVTLPVTDTYTITFDPLGTNTGSANVRVTSP